MRPQEYILQRSSNRQMHVNIVRHAPGQAYVVGVSMKDGVPYYSGAIATLHPKHKGEDRETANRGTVYAYRVRVWAKKI